MAEHNTELARRAGEMGDLLSLRSDTALARHYYGLEETYRDMALWCRNMALTKEARMKARRSLMVSALALVALLLLTGMTVAQEVPGVALTPLPEGSPVVVALPDQSTVYAGFVVLAMLLLGIISALQHRSTARLIDTVNKTLENKIVREVAEQRYMESSLPVQEFIKLLAGVTTLTGSLNIPGIDPLADKAAEFLNDVITKPAAPPTTEPASGGK